MARAPQTKRNGKVEEHSILQDTCQKHSHSEDVGLGPVPYYTDTAFSYTVPYRIRIKILTQKYGTYFTGRNPTTPYPYMAYTFRIRPYRICIGFRVQKYGTVLYEPYPYKGRIIRPVSVYGTLLRMEKQHMKWESARLCALVHMRSKNFCIMAIVPVMKHELQRAAMEKPVFCNKINKRELMLTGSRGDSSLDVVPST
ncbi:uncharacterized protein FOMMEDRAFT_161935 [Fomitiporia mediterranea MF3/22]|uniref:uncharacterized protein n=1 Tax=Fomitiporia mediterranea (strain MF3/22) TaxID=694068 RepID=UPI0004408AB6|nr:uncharacterized protein FOMMEDRAFT_161935 [Fomitiporia mediterranea MF3/22]EJC98183.1 hypothetical protein FOMMEDRAFT_161935 [Fomitiporia mediterranea MF3/22]